MPFQPIENNELSLHSVTGAMENVRFKTFMLPAC